MRPLGVCGVQDEVDGGSSCTMLNIFLAMYPNTTCDPI